MTLKEHIVDFLITYCLLIVFFFMDSGPFRTLAPLIMALAISDTGYLVGRLI